MITTAESKEEQLKNGYFQRGSGPTEILILGSCRTIPYLNYLVRYNTIWNNPFTIRRIDPCDWMGMDLEPFESDERILSVIKSTTIFIHEYLQNYGMFNTDQKAGPFSIRSPKSIYDFGMNSETDISIPNWHDHLILENDYVAYGSTAPLDYIEKGEAEIEKFLGVCKKSSFPEFADTFDDTWREIRYFWRPNHVSARFTGKIFESINSKFLKLPLSLDFWNAIYTEDLFASPHTDVTQRDRDGYHITW